MKLSFFFANYCIGQPFNFGYSNHFYEPKKDLSSSVFSIKILVAETFGCY